MNPQDRQAIDTVFARLDDVSRNNSQRDAEAEQYIATQLNQRPGAAYYLAQTVLVQQQALEAAQQRLQQAERTTPSGDAAGDASSFGRFGRSRPSGPGGAGASMAPPVPPPSNGFGRSAGGGFLAGAAQTAIGVAGGMMLGSLLGNMFGGNDAHAAPAEPAEPAADAGADAHDHGDAGGDSWDDGGDMGDGGGDF